MNLHEEKTLEGGCACGSVRYRLEADPLIVHACHCRNCQRQTGTSHAVNALVELSGHPHGPTWRSYIYGERWKAQVNSAELPRDVSPRPTGRWSRPSETTIDALRRWSSAHR